MLGEPTHAAVWPLPVRVTAVPAGAAAWLRPHTHSRPMCCRRRPGVYREYMRDLCDRVSSAQSHNIHKLVGFEPFAPAALAFRIAATASALRAGASSGTGGGARSLMFAASVARLVATWMLLLAAKVGLGYLLKLIATAYLQHYEAKRGARHARRSAVLQHTPLPAAAISKKQE